MKLIIDGKTIEAQEGMTVFEAAKAAGIYIPSLCYHPAVSPVRYLPVVCSGSAGNAWTAWLLHLAGDGRDDSSY